MTRAAFDENFFGLQLAWEDDDEIEYLGRSVLAGNATYTAATCKRGGRSHSYVYPVSVKHHSRGQLRLSYEQNPTGWPQHWGWEVCKGDLIIDFREEGSLVPRQVSFWYRDSGEVSLLEEGPDWTFKEPDPANLLKVARGRLKVSRIARPEQQRLRNLLISEHGQCQLTGTRCPEVLEACHIFPVARGGVDTVANALLLRCDIHALFDAGLLRLKKAGSHWMVDLDPSVEDPTYRDLRHAKLLGASTTSGQFLAMREHLGC